MKLEYFYDITQGSDEWLKARLGIVTASEMASLITPTGKVAQNDDARGIVYQKVAERITRRAEEKIDNVHTRRGHLFEPFARDLYSKRVADVHECGFIRADYKEFSIGYSPDGLVGEDGLVEIMCPNQVNHVKEICENSQPKTKIMQAQTGLMITGRKWCDYIGHFNGMRQRIVRLYPDKEIHEKIMEAALNLEECIKINLERYYENSINMPKAKYERGL